MWSRWWLLWFVLGFGQARGQLGPEPATVRVSVLSLFHPEVLTLSADHAVRLLADGAPRVLDGRRVAMLRADGDRVEVDGVGAETLLLPVETFTLGVPGKIARVYRGALTVRARGGVLVAVVTMDTELAVASIVAAEVPAGTPFAAMEAQAIASRSYLLANGRRHAFSDACDTTHCQFLRAPPGAGSGAARATAATRGRVLTWESEGRVRMVSAMYSRSCGGRTGTLARAGVYPFYAVRCEYCLRHPGLAGRGVGHRLGMCQLGAAAMARKGVGVGGILSYFYANTRVVLLG
jgi:hypothetical protein